MSSDEDVKSIDFVNRLKAEDQAVNILHSCCGGASDKRLIIMMSQVIFSMLTLVFSFTMLSMNPHDENAIYLSLITSVLSYWLGKNENIK
jgi:hypothetical protein